MLGRVRRRRTARRNESGALLLKIGIVVVVLVLAAVAAVVAGLVPTIGRPGSSASSSAGPPPADGPRLDLVAPPKAARLFVPTTGRPPISIAGLRRHLAGVLSLPDLAGQVGFAVSQLGNPSDGWHEGAAAVTPASTLKLLTTSAALETLGPDHRFTTSVVQGPGRGSIVLVGGGDPLLAAVTPTAQQAEGLYPQPASLQELAAATAARLSSEGVRRVRLSYDASLFTGPSVNPHWPSTYVPENVVSPISALWVDEGRVSPGLALRSADPALVAAGVFRTQLRFAGVTVVGPLEEKPPPAGKPAVVAAVSSAPLEEIVQHILELSDNEGAEVLLRQVAIAAGEPGSSAAGVTAVRTALTGLGLDLHGAVFYDGSGLSRQDVLPVQLLLHVLETASSSAHPELRGVITGLPVAGFSGSLGYRFTDTVAGRGYVRAKTGTLTGVDGLAGVAMTPSGQALVFVAVANGVPVEETLDARGDLDKLAAALVTCGC